MRKILGNKLEAKVWQKPCQVWNTVNGQYGAAKYMAEGDITMLMQYLHHPHPHHLRAVYSTIHLHFPRNSYHQLKSLTRYTQNLGEVSARRGNLGRRWNNIVTGQSRKWREDEMMKEEKKQKVCITAQSCRPDYQLYSHSQAWRSVQSQVQHHAQLLLVEGRVLTSLFKAKQYCQLSLWNTVRMDRVAGLWDGYQRGFVDKCLRTIKQLHGRSLPLSQEVQIGSRQTLTMLIQQQIKQFIGSSLKQQNYLIPTFKALIYQHSLPIQEIGVLFQSREKMKKILLGCSQFSEWREQLNDILRHHYSNACLQQSLKSAQSIQSLLPYFRNSYNQSDSDRQNRECMIYGVLRILVERQENHYFFMQLLSPIFHYSSLSKSDFLSQQLYQYERENMKNSYEALIKVCVESRSYRHDEWSTPRWWGMPRY